MVRWSHRKNGQAEKHLSQAEASPQVKPTAKATASPQQLRALLTKASKNKTEMHKKNIRKNNTKNKQPTGRMNFPQHNQQKTARIVRKNSNQS